MARMLQALKNLEAKVVRAPVEKEAAQANKAPVSPPVVQKEPAAEVFVAPIAGSATATIDAVIPRAVEVVDRLDAVVAGELADVSSSPAISVVAESFNFGHSDFAFVGQRTERTFGVSESPAAIDDEPNVQPSFERTSEPAATAATAGNIPSPPVESPEIAEIPVSQSPSTTIDAPAQHSIAATVTKTPNLSAPVKTPSALERQVRWLLNDPVRSQPVIELVERVSRDIEQINGKSVAFVTVGTDGALPGPLLPVAVLLAEQLRKQVLLVDGDTARCRLSTGMQCGQNSGLSELLQGGETHETCCVPTATRDLSFLPAGQLRHCDVSTSGSAFEDLLGQLTSENDCVLIEVGSAGSSNAAALARQVDATYLVVELGAVETVAARKALNDLRATGARVLGCIAT